MKKTFKQFVNEHIKPFYHPVKKGESALNVDSRIHKHNTAVYSRLKAKPKK